MLKDNIVVGSTKVTKKASKKASKKSTASGRPVGRSSGVGIQETWVKAFRENENRRQPDETITKYMKSEFPGRQSLVFERVAGVRAKYNKGGLTGGEVPSVQSRRFGDDGKEVTTRGFAIAPKGGAKAGSKSSKKVTKKKVMKAA